MATFKSCFFQVDNTTSRINEMPAPRGKGVQMLDDLTTSATAQAPLRSASAWTAPADGYVSCKADGSVLVACGETAARTGARVGAPLDSGDGWLQLSIRQGEALSVIDA